MDFRNIIDLPDGRKKKKTEKKYYGLLSVSIILIGSAFLFRDNNNVVWNSLVLLSSVFFAGYLTMNFINWEEKRPHHFIQYLGNLGFTAGLMLKILKLPYDNTLIFISIALVFISVLVSMFQKSE